MIVSSFFSANLRKVLNWVTDANLGNRTSSSFNIPLQASRPCTFTLVSVSPSDVNVSLSGNVVYISNNPRIKGTLPAVLKFATDPGCRVKSVK